MSSNPRLVHPGKVLLEDVMRPLGVSRNRLARDIDVPVGRVSSIVSGSRAITADTALRLAKYFGTTAELWMKLQADYELAVARATVWENIDPRIRVFDANAVVMAEDAGEISASDLPDTPSMSSDDDPETRFLSEPEPEMAEPGPAEEEDQLFRDKPLRFGAEPASEITAPAAPVPLDTDQPLPAELPAKYFAADDAPEISEPAAPVRLDTDESSLAELPAMHFAAEPSPETSVPAPSERLDADERTDPEPPVLRFAAEAAPEISDPLPQEPLELGQPSFLAVREPETRELGPEPFELTNRVDPPPFGIPAHIAIDPRPEEPQPLELTNRADAPASSAFAAAAEHAFEARFWDGTDHETDLAIPERPKRDVA